MGSEEKQRNLKLSILDEIKNSKNLINKLRHITSKRKLNDVIPLKILLSQTENDTPIEKSELNKNIDSSQIATISGDCTNEKCSQYIATISGDCTNEKCSQANEQDFNNVEIDSDCEQFYNNTTKISIIPYQDVEDVEDVEIVFFNERNNHEQTSLNNEGDKDLPEIKSCDENITKQFKTCEISCCSSRLSNESPIFERTLETESNLNSHEILTAINFNPSIDCNVNDTDKELLVSSNTTNCKNSHDLELKESQSTTDYINYAKVLFTEGVEEKTENFNNNDKTCIESNKIPHIEKPSEIEIPSKKITKSKNDKKPEDKNKPMFVNTLTNEKLIKYELSLQNELKDIQRAENLKHKLREENSRLRNTTEVKSYFDSTSIMPKINSIKSLNASRSKQKYSKNQSIELHKKRQQIHTETTDSEHMVKKEEIYNAKENMLDILSTFSFDSLTSLNNCSMNESSSIKDSTIKINKITKNISLNSNAEKCLLRNENLNFSKLNDNLSNYSNSTESTRSRQGYIENSGQSENDEEILSLLETFFLHHNLQQQSQLEQQIQLASECDDAYYHHNINKSEHEGCQSIQMRNRGGYCSNCKRFKKSKTKNLRAKDCNGNLKSSNNKSNKRPRAGGIKKNKSCLKKKSIILSCCDTNQSPPPPPLRKVKISKPVDINLGPGYGAINLLNENFFETIRDKIVDKILTDLNKLL